MASSSITCCTSPLPPWVPRRTPPRSTMSIATCRGQRSRDLDPLIVGHSSSSSTVPRDREPVPEARVPAAALYEPGSGARRRPRLLIAPVTSPCPLPSSPGLSVEAKGPRRHVASGCPILPVRSSRSGTTPGSSEAREPATSASTDHRGDRLGGGRIGQPPELRLPREDYCFPGLPRRAHSSPPRGGFNAGRTTRTTGTRVLPLLRTREGGYRAGANVFARAVSGNIIDQCVPGRAVRARVRRAALEPSLRRGAGLAHLLRRGQTGQQLLLRATRLSRRSLGNVEMYPRTEMLDLIVVDGRARGIVTRDLVSGKVESHTADAVILATGGYSNVFFLSTNAKGCNTTASGARTRRGPGSPIPLHADPPDEHPVSGDHSRTSRS